MNSLKFFLQDDEKLHLVFAGIGILSLAASFFPPAGGWPLDPAWLAVILCGLPIIKEAFIGLVTEFDVTADVLVAIALVAAVIIGEMFAAGEVAVIMTLGSLLEERTVRKAREGIEKLVNLTPSTACVVREGVEAVIPAPEVGVGDIVRLRPGETLPVDGVIVTGRTSIDQSLLTGESLPVDREPGDDVFSGTVNQFGTFDMKALKVGEDSSLQRMIRLVDSADAEKTPIVRIVDKWAAWIVLAALLTAIGTWLVTGEIIRAVTILVVFCPCALVLSTPTAIMAGIGNATRFGILITSGDTLERLARVTKVAFDKTGTLTFGKPETIAVESFVEDLRPDDILALAAGLEQRSEHPLGRAIARHAVEKQLAVPEPQAFTMLPGRGVTGEAGGRSILAGNRPLLEENGLQPGPVAEEAARVHEQTGATIVFVALDGNLAGLIALSDTLRPDAATTVSALHQAGVGTTLLTGDLPEAAQAIAAAVGIDDVHARLRPEDKMEFVQEKTQETQGQFVCMVGDGINDAPALKSAYIGLAVGGVGSDIAVDAADGVLVREDIKNVPHLLKLGRQTARTIRVNISLSMLLNLITVVLAATGLMGPVAGALAHNAGAFLIVANSARLLSYR